jgi:hypothetical protein
LSQPPSNYIVKRPDNYAENAGLMPYGSNVSAPAIVLPDTDLFKTQRGTEAKHYFDDRLRALESEYESIRNLAADTEAVYKSHYNFVPIVGKIYHLYEGKQKIMLSMIEPQEWNLPYLGSFVFTHNSTWERITWQKNNCP